MNSRIKELVEQAKKYADEYWYEHSPSWFEFYNKKFAELVVKECVDIIQRESEKAIRNNTYMGEDVPASVIQVAIKEHFGV